MSNYGNRVRAKKRAAAPLFVVRAERALRRAGRKVQAQNRKLGIPLIGWKDGKITAG